MKALSELLAGWDRGELTSEETAELKRLLAAPEARAALVDEWLVHEAIIGALQALPETVAAREADEAAARLALPARPAPRAAGWRRFLPRLVWRDVRIPLRLAFGLAALAVLLAVYVFRSTPAGQITDARGTVTLVRAGQLTPARVGERVFPGDVLRVGKAGAALLAWPGEQTDLELGTDTELRVDGRLLGKKLALRAGRLAARVGPQPAGRPLVVRTPQAEVTVRGTRFSLAIVTNTTRLDVTQGAVALRSAGARARPVEVQAGATAMAAAGSAPTIGAGTGYAIREVVALPERSRPLSAEGRVVWSDVVTNFAGLGRSARVALADTNRYAQRLRAWFVPPVTGDYHLWIDSRGRSELWFSADEQPANRRRVASVAVPAVERAGEQARSFAWNLVVGEMQQENGQWVEIPVSLTGDFSRQANQKSTLLPLVGGRPYYVEALHEFTPDDVVIVAWTRVSGGTEVASGFMDGAMLRPFLGDPTRLAAAGSR